MPTSTSTTTVSGDDVDVLPPEEIFCKKQACAIQYCLNRSNHQEKKCQVYVDAYNDCKTKARAKAGWSDFKVAGSGSGSNIARSSNEK